MNTAPTATTTPATGSWMSTFRANWRRTDDALLAHIMPAVRLATAGAAAAFVVVCPALVIVLGWFPGITWALGSLIAVPVATMYVRIGHAPTLPHSATTALAAAR